jgi:hypothetical protein
LFNHKNHTTCAKRLGALCTFQVISEVEKDNKHRATRYRYLPSESKAKEKTKI